MTDRITRSLGEVARKFFRLRSSLVEVGRRDAPGCGFGLEHPHVVGPDVGTREGGTV